MKDKYCGLLLDLYQLLKKKGIKFEVLNQLVDEYFTSCTKPTPQTPLKVKVSHIGFATSIAVTWENNHNPEITPNSSEFFHRKIREKSSICKCVTVWDINIKLVLASITMRLVSSEIGTLWVVCNLPYSNSYTFSFTRI